MVIERMAPMNRAAIIIVIVLLLWSNLALGLSGVCHCDRDIRESGKCQHDHGQTGRHDSSCNHSASGNNNCHDRCLSFRLSQELSPAELQEIDSGSKQDQTLILPGLTVDAPESLGTVLLNPGQFFCDIGKHPPLFLQTCSFLS